MVTGSNPSLLAIYRSFSHTLEHLGVESDDAIRTACSPNQCHIPRPYLVSLLEREEGHDQMSIAQSV
jgi:hypothetical protein